MHVAFTTPITDSGYPSNFGALDEPEDNTNVARFLLIFLFVCAFTCASIAVYLFGRPHNRHLEPTPYDAIISQLRPDMSEQDVLDLFNAASQSQVAGEFAVYSEMNRDGAHDVVAYRTGKDQPLVVRFSAGGRGHIEEWCYSGRCHPHIY